MNFYNYLYCKDKNTAELRKKIYVRLRLSFTTNPGLLLKTEKNIKKIWQFLHILPANKAPKSEGQQIRTLEMYLFTERFLNLHSV